MIHITLLNSVYDAKQKKYTAHREGTCLSSDTKPTDWAGGSVLLEIDTSKVYIYDQQNSVWKEW